jgi:hypothetical protein
MNLEPPMLTYESAESAAAQSSAIQRMLGTGDAALRAESDRRAHPRLDARELSWLRTSRFKYGPSVRLIDLSVGGALLESDVQLRPGSNLALELDGASRVVVPLRVIRCQLTSLREKPLYRGACAFTQLTELPGLSLQPSTSIDARWEDGGTNGLAAGSAFDLFAEFADADAAAQPSAALALPPGLVEAPSSMSSAWRMVILRYLDGALLKGFCNDFSSTRTQFHLWPSVNAEASQRMMVPLARLKAVFFVRDFGGNAAYVERREFDGAAHGRKMEITFIDGEVVIGTTLAYRPDGPGFFLHPADALSNNMRIFIVTASVRHTRFI